MTSMAHPTPSWSTLIASLPALPAMPETRELLQHVKPFICADLDTKALHFSISEIQSRMQIHDPHALDLEYTRTMMGFLLFKPEPRDIAMIGLGGGSLAKFCFLFLPQARIQVVEINPHVIALRDEFHVPPDDDRFSVLQGDGAAFVRDGDATCDVLMVDGFDCDGQPSHLSSQAFYDACFERLQPDGMLVVNLFSHDALYDLYVDRIRRSFSDQVLVVNGIDHSNGVVLACKGNAFDLPRPALARRPGNLDETAARQLNSGFAAILKALRIRQG